MTNVSNSVKLRYTISSVAATRFLYCSRMSCCFASSRENTVTRRGRPISPPRRRRMSTLPREPVPPVTTMCLPSSGRVRSRSTACPFVVRCGIGRQLGDHCRPRGRAVSRRVHEPARVECAVTQEGVVRHEGDVEAKGPVHHREQVVLADLFASNVPDAAQLRPVLYQVPD